MKQKNWKDLAELFGIATIVASLVFVGLQMKQSQDIAIASHYHDRAALAVENFNAEMESGDLTFWASLLPIGRSTDVTIEDHGRRMLGALKYITMIDNHYYQYQAGFLDEESWQVQFQGLKLLMARNPLARAIIEQRGILARPTFFELADEVIAEMDSADSQ